MADRRYWSFNSAFTGLMRKRLSAGEIDGSSRLMSISASTSRHGIRGRIIARATQPARTWAAGWC
jgi:hypothetical protein